MMTQVERKAFEELADAYRILREAYHRDMHRESPPLSDLQIRVQAILAANTGWGV